MLIDGEKWACEACVRGHRVSNCQHADRPLQHINKKGRPISQCHHCRSLRKSRATHIKCDCGERLHKCVHLQAVVDGHHDSCCCNHGGRCTCSYNNEHPLLDTVLESDSEDEATKPRVIRGAGVQQHLRTRAKADKAEALLSFDEYGHHKPIKHNKAAQLCGPYPLSRVESLQSRASSVGHRSVDDLLHKSGKQGGTPRSSKSPAACGGDSGPVHDQRKTRSETASPALSGISSLGRRNGRLPPLDLSMIERRPYVPNSAEFFGNYSDHEQPMFSAGLSASSVDWSHYDGLELASGSRPDSAVGFAPSKYSHPQSNGFDFSGSEPMHTITTNTSTSGDLSEVEDVIPNGLDEYEFDATATCGGDNPVYSTSTASSGFDMMAVPLNLMGGGDLRALEYDNLLTKNLGGVRDKDDISTKSTPLAAEDVALVNTTGLSMNLVVYSPVDDAPTFWVDTTQSHGVPVLGEIADPDGSFWEAR